MISVHLEHSSFLLTAPDIDLHDWLDDCSWYKLLFLSFRLALNAREHWHEWILLIFTYLTSHNLSQLHTLLQTQPPEPNVLYSWHFIGFQVSNDWPHYHRTVIFLPLLISFFFIALDDYLEYFCCLFHRKVHRLHCNLLEMAFSLHFLLRLYNLSWGNLLYTRVFNGFELCHPLQYELAEHNDDHDLLFHLQFEYFGTSTPYLL